MKDRLKILKSFLPPEASERLRIKKISQGELILPSLDGSIFFIQKGSIGAISHYEKREYFLPLKFRPGDIVGLLKSIFVEKSWWEFIAITDAEIILFPRDIVDNYLLNNFAAYKHLTREGIYITERLAQALHIQVQGGARALFAYGLVEYSINNEYKYIKYENVAKTLNITRARLYKIEEEFTKKGLIRKERKKIIILNREGLKDYYREFLFME
ncbi:hypothetical protein PM10SUCC1_09870 [Propionigenium maris DSM 9537]|uniref:cAMP-binding domain of CRP or a regulatory subunit of cAMP-dependent protein kinases n=1 Tax=Propionigenium maris DSM 9537 TaxID=1123000 RepID=A0A9W6LMI2_9FUSO|nr:helix-turn-helix domain-containing protein [Propionigenium maris]GLI55473.1 hypothetical protein PM10SUCC1_09870 [Propionigenium maris DSM 9537]